MDQVSFWKHYPKTTIIAATWIIISLLLLAWEPEFLLTWKRGVLQPILVVVAMCGMATFFALTFLLERRQKYAIIITLVGILIFFSIVTVFADIFLEYFLD